MPRPQVSRARGVDSTKARAQAYGDTPVPRRSGRLQGSPLVGLTRAPKETRKKTAIDQENAASVIPISPVKGTGLSLRRASRGMSKQASMLDFASSMTSEFQIGHPAESSTPIRPGRSLIELTPMDDEQTPTAGRKRRAALTDISNTPSKKPRTSIGTRKSLRKIAEIDSVIIVPDEDEITIPASTQTPPEEEEIIPVKQTRSQHRSASIVEEMIVSQPVTKTIEITSSPENDNDDTPSTPIFQRNRPITDQAKAFKRGGPKTPRTGAAPPVQTPLPPSPQTSLSPVEVSDADNSEAESSLSASPIKPQPQDDDDPFSLDFLRANLKGVKDAGIMINDRPKATKTRTLADRPRRGLRKTVHDLPVPKNRQLGTGTKANETISENEIRISSVTTRNRKKKPRYNDVAIYDMLSPVQLSSSDEDGANKKKKASDVNVSETKSDAKTRNDGVIEYEEYMDSDESMYVKPTLKVRPVSNKDSADDNTTERRTEKDDASEETTDNDDNSGLRRSARVRESLLSPMPDVVALDDSGEPIEEVVRQPAKKRPSYGGRRKSIFADSDAADTTSSSERLLPSRSYKGPPVTEILERQRVRIAKRHGEITDSDKGSSKENTDDDNVTRKAQRAGAKNKISNKASKDKPKPKRVKDIFDFLSDSDETSENEVEEPSFSASPVEASTSSSDSNSEAETKKSRVKQTRRRVMLEEQKEAERRRQEALSQLKKKFEEIDKWKLKVDTVSPDSSQDIEVEKAKGEETEGEKEKEEVGKDNNVVLESDDEDDIFGETDLSRLDENDGPILVD